MLIYASHIERKRERERGVNYIKIIRCEFLIVSKQYINNNEDTYYNYILDTKHNILSYFYFKNHIML
jgi:hypothetical protein